MKGRVGRMNSQAWAAGRVMHDKETVRTSRFEDKVHGTEAMGSIVRDSCRCGIGGSG